MEKKEIPKKAAEDGKALKYYEFTAGMGQAKVPSGGVKRVLDGDITQMFMKDACSFDFETGTWVPRFGFKLVKAAKKPKLTTEAEKFQDLQDQIAKQAEELEELKAGGDKKKAPSDAL